MKLKLEQHPKDFGCAVCAADLSSQVDDALRDWAGRSISDSTTVPSRATLHCDKCDTATEFRLEWELVLRHAEPISYEVMP